MSAKMGSQACMQLSVTRQCLRCNKGIHQSFCVQSEHEPSVLLEKAQY